MGAVQVDDILDGSPNKGILQVGDLIVKINGDRIKNIPQLMNAVDGSQDKDKIKVGLIRDGKSKDVTVSAVDGTDLVIQGIRALTNQACTLPEVKERPICKERLVVSGK